jgi:hypothetical protein
VQVLGLDAKALESGPVKYRLCSSRAHVVFRASVSELDEGRERGRRLGEEGLAQFWCELRAPVGVAALARLPC